MNVLLLTIQIDIPWVNSLKEKRSIIKSLIAKLQNQFNASVVESDTQDLHKTITISIAIITFNSAQMDHYQEEIISYIELNTDGEITKIEREVL